MNELFQTFFKNIILRCISETVVNVSTSIDMRSALLKRSSIVNYKELLTKSLYILLYENDTLLF